MDKTSHLGMITKGAKGEISDFYWFDEPISSSA